MRSLLKGHSLRFVLTVVGLAYPFLVYAGLRYASPAVPLAALVALAVLRLAIGRNGTLGGFLAPVFWIAAAGALLLVALSPLVGLRAYPILVSLGLAGLFAHSLWRPPSMIERIARLREPDPPPAAIAYFRGVTLAWLGFFLVNAALSAATALGGSLELWTFYNGFLSYLIMGALFLGEWILRGHWRSRGVA